MKITGFNPMIISAKADSVIETFETQTSKSVFLMAPSGFAIDLVKHLK